MKLEIFEIFFFYFGIIYWMKIVLKKMKWLHIKREGLYRDSYKNN